MTTPTHGEQLPDVVMPTCDHHQLLKGQKAIVTGANSGIGKGIAIALGEAGADVVVNYVHDERTADEVVQNIRRCGSKAYSYCADVSSEPQVVEMFQKMVKEFGAIHILINNAGLQKDAPFDQMTLDQWNFVIGVNLTGQFLCAQKAIPLLKASANPSDRDGRFPPVCRCTARCAE